VQGWDARVVQGVVGGWVMGVAGLVGVRWNAEEVAVKARCSGVDKGPRVDSACGEDACQAGLGARKPRIAVLRRCMLSSVRREPCRQAQLEQSMCAVDFETSTSAEGLPARSIHPPHKIVCTMQCLHC
jgi:hypothetical protein